MERPYENKAKKEVEEKVIELVVSPFWTRTKYNSNQGV